MAGETHLKTQQVAEALGVSVSTVKRWVDAGELRAARTVGRHRLIPVAEAVQFARERGLPWQAGPAKVVCEEGQPVEIDDRTRAGLAASLAAGRSREAADLILAAHASCRSAAVLGDDLIRPVMERVGHHWQFGVLNVYQEHRATQIVERALRDLAGRADDRPAEPGRPLAIGAAPEGDPYTIPGLLCEQVLREAGWEAMNLGPNLPLASLAKATRQHRPGLVWLSASYLADPARFLRDYEGFYRQISTLGAAVVVGGQAVGADLRAKMRAAGFGDRLAHLDEFARAWRAAIATTANRPTAASDRGPNGATDPHLLDADPGVKGA